MSKIKVKTLIGSVVTVIFFLTVIVAFLFYAFPENVASSTGLGPYDGQRILSFCALLVAALLLLGWLVERAFDYAGKSGLYVHWNQNKKQIVAPVAQVIAGAEDDSEPVFQNEQMTEHLRLRYGRRWQRQVRILLVMGNKDEVQKVAPGLCRDLWQEGDGNVLVYGGDAQSKPDEVFLSRLKSLRSGKSVDGIVQVMNTAALPTDTERDAFLRCRQKADYFLGWQAPVWLWLTDKETTTSDKSEPVATGALFGPGVTPQDALTTLEMLIPRLRQAGMSQVLNNPHHNWLLQLYSRLQGDLKTSLSILLNGLMQGTAAFRLRGMMFSPELAVAGSVPNTRIDTPGWAMEQSLCRPLSV